MENKFKFALEHAPKSATYFDGSEYGHMNDEGSFVISLSVPEFMFVKGMKFTPTPLKCIEIASSMVKSGRSESEAVDYLLSTSPLSHQKS